MVSRLFLTGLFMYMYNKKTPGVNTTGANRKQNLKIQIQVMS